MTLPCVLIQTIVKSWLEANKLNSDSAMAVTWVVESPSLVYNAPPNAGQSTSSHPTVTMQDKMQPICQYNLPDIIPQLAVWVI